MRKKINDPIHSRDHTDTVGEDKVHSDTIVGDTGRIDKHTVVTNDVDARCFSVITDTQDKYDLALRFKPKHKEKIT